MTRFALAAVLGLVVAAGSGCQKRVDYIQVTPGLVTFKNKNEDVWLSAMAKSHNGTQYPKMNVAWSVKDPSVAFVDGTGMLKPLKSGRTEVVATLGDVRANIPVEVILAEKMMIEPNPLVLKADGEPGDFTVKVFDYQGRELRDRKATFNSSDKKIVTMAQERAFPGDVGTAKIEVRVGGLLQMVEVEVEK